MIKSVLILGECSGAIARAAMEAGHSAVTVDLKAAEYNAQCHLRCDWDEFFSDPETFNSYDLVIWHPVCTSLSVSGNWVYAAGKEKHAKRLQDLEYVGYRWRLLKFHARAAALENPRGVLASKIGRPSQTVQPYEFGADASKATDLWLHNLDPLPKDPAKRVAGRIVASGAERWANQTDSGQNRLGPSDTRAAERAKTYPGIARAMIANWL